MYRFTEALPSTSMMDRIWQRLPLLWEDTYVEIVTAFTTGVWAIVLLTNGELTHETLGDVAAALSVVSGGPRVWIGWALVVASVKVVGVAGYWFAPKRPLLLVRLSAVVGGMVLWGAIALACLQVLPYSFELAASSGLWLLHIVLATRLTMTRHYYTDALREQ